MKLWLENNLISYREATPTYRVNDIRNVEIYSINFPVKNGPVEGVERSFGSALQAAEILISLGKTETDKPMTVARNIFAAAMACEGREDRNTDRRWSAYKNNAGDTILWAFTDPKDLSPENYEVYLEQHPNSSASEVNDPEDVKKCKELLNKEKFYDSYKRVEKELGFVWPTWMTKAKFADKGFVVIPNNIVDVGKTLKFQKEKYPSDDNRKRAWLYIGAIYNLQKKGYLPKKERKIRK